jgi:hypothetical protein
VFLGYKKFIHFCAGRSPLHLLSRFATGDRMKLTVTVDVMPKAGVAKSKVDETKVALRELGLPETVRTTGSDS